MIRKTIVITMLAAGVGLAGCSSGDGDGGNGGNPAAPVMADDGSNGNPTEGAPTEEGSTPEAPGGQTDAPGTGDPAVPPPPGGESGEAGGDDNGGEPPIVAIPVEGAEVEGDAEGLPPPPDIPGTEPPVAEMPVSNEPDTQDPGTEQPGVEQPGTEQPGVEQPTVPPTEGGETPVEGTTRLPLTGALRELDFDPASSPSTRAIRARELLDNSAFGAMLNTSEVPFTIFVPTDAAFAALGLTLDELLADPEALANILAYHIIDGEELDRGTLNALSSQTLVMSNGQSNPLSQNGDQLMIGSALISDAPGGGQVLNGVFYLIDQVLIPGSSE